MELISCKEAKRLSEANLREHLKQYIINTEITLISCINIKILEGEFEAYYTTKSFSKKEDELVLNYLEPMLQKFKEKGYDVNYELRNERKYQIHISWDKEFDWSEI